MKEQKSRITDERASRRRKSGPGAGSSAVIAAALFLLLYIPSAFNWFSSKNVSTDILRSGTLEESINTDALVIRDETLIAASVSGVAVPYAGEGSRVAAGEKVSRRAALPVGHPTPPGSLPHSGCCQRTRPPSE